MDRYKKVYNEIIEIISILLIGVIMIYLLNKNLVVFDLTKNKKYSISKELINYLNSLDSNIYVKVLYNKGSKEYSDLIDFLGKLSRYSNKLKYDFLDPRRDLTLANLYGFSSNNQVLFIYKDRKKFESSVIDQDKFYSIVFNLVNQKKGNVAFISGHGEYSLDNADALGLSKLKQFLTEEGYNFKIVNLASENLYVNENLLTCIISPKVDIASFELKKIEDYLYSGGRLIVAFNSRYYSSEKFPNLTKIINSYGIKVTDYACINPISINYVYVMAFPVNLPYLSSIYNTNLVMFIPLVLERGESNASLSEVLTTKAVAVDINKLNKGVLKLANGNNLSEYTLCMMSEKPNKDKKSMLLVVGDSNIFSNSLISEYSNNSFVMSVIDYMLDQPVAKSLRPNEVPPLPVVVERKQLIIMFLIYLLLPFLFMAIIFPLVIRRRLYAKFRVK